MIVVLSDSGHIHLIGIGGIGMSGLARLLFALPKFTVSGSDIERSSITDSLIELGIPITVGHSYDTINNCVDFVVISSAIDSENVELQHARALDIPIIHRTVMLAHIMKGYK